MDRRHSVSLEMKHSNAQILIHQSALVYYINPRTICGDTTFKRKLQSSYMLYSHLGPPSICASLARHLPSLNPPAYKVADPPAHWDIPKKHQSILQRLD